MTSLLLLPLLLTLFPPTQDPVAVEEGAPVVVVSSRWFRDRQPVENAGSALLSPAAAMTNASKNFEKQKRINSPAGERDPNADTLDSRSSQLDRIVQESREAPPVSGFAYQVKLQNASTKPTEKVFWEYQFKELANPSNVVHRQFLCSARIKPDKDRDFQVFSLSGPSEVISAKSLAKGSEKQFAEAVVINRVEYSDGTYWQRKDWKFDLTRLNSQTRQASNLPVCRSF